MSEHPRSGDTRESLSTMYHFSTLEGATACGGYSVMSDVYLCPRLYDFYQCSSRYTERAYTVESLCSKMVLSIFIDVDVKARPRRLLPV